MPYEVHTTRAAGKKKVPNGTKLELRLGARPGTVHVSIQFPGQQRASDLGDVEIVDGVTEVPVKLLFLSYAHEDQRTVEAIADQLWQDGFLT